MACRRGSVRWRGACRTHQAGATSADPLRPHLCHPRAALSGRGMPAELHVGPAGTAGQLPAGQAAACTPVPPAGAVAPAAMNAAVCSLRHKTSSISSAGIREGTPGGDHLRGRGWGRVGGGSGQAVPPGSWYPAALQELVSSCPAGRWYPAALPGGGIQLPCRNRCPAAPPAALPGTRPLTALLHAGGDTTETPCHP